VRRRGTGAAALANERAAGYQSAAEVNLGDRRAMAMDQELQRHMETWLGFTRLLKWSIAGIVITLLILAAWLV
jgi:hypothetical protein